MIVDFDEKSKIYLQLNSRGYIELKDQNYEILTAKNNKNKLVSLKLLYTNLIEADEAVLIMIKINDYLKKNLEKLYFELDDIFYIENNNGSKIIVIVQQNHFGNNMIPEERDIEDVDKMILQTLINLLLKNWLSYIEVIILFSSMRNIENNIINIILMIIFLHFIVMMMIISYNYFKNNIRLPII